MGLHHSGCKALIRALLCPYQPDSMLDCCIPQEGHKIKNPSIRLSKVVRNIPAQQRYADYSPFSRRVVRILKFAV